MQKNRHKIMKRQQERDPVMPADNKINKLEGNQRGICNHKSFVENKLELSPACFLVVPLLCLFPSPRQGEMCVNMVKKGGQGLHSHPAL